MGEQEGWSCKGGLSARHAGLGGCRRPQDAGRVRRWRTQGEGLDGRIRSKDTIPPGNDPNPPKDREH